MEYNTYLGKIDRSLKTTDKKEHPSSFAVRSCLKGK